MKMLSKWESPKYENKRFGYEVTLYVAAESRLDKRLAIKVAKEARKQA